VKKEISDCCLTLDIRWPIDQLLDSLLDETNDFIEKGTYNNAKKETKTDDLIVQAIFG
jgi:hypothetical protein